MSLSEVLKTALDQIQYIAKTETVVGEPITAGDVTLIPVSKVSIGFAAGGAGKDDKTGSGSGTGGGVTITPVAVIAVVNGRVQVHPLVPGEPILGKIMEFAPDILKNISKYFKKGNELKKDGKEKG